MRFTKIISFCSSLNLILTIAGYSFITTFLLPLSGGSDGLSQIVTIPYRIVVLFLSLIIIFLLIKDKLKINHWVRCLIFFWILYICRIVFDLSFRFDNFFTLESKYLYYSFVFFISFIPFLSLVFSYKYIDFDIVLKCSILLLTISMVASLFSNSMLEEESRLTGNIALNPISYGEVGAKAIILSVFFFTRNRKWVSKTALFCIIILGFLTLGRAASRGPLLGMFIVLIFYIVSIQKNPIKTIVSLVFLLALIYVFQNYIIDFTGVLSPTLKARVEASVYENDTSSRGELFTDGIQQFLNNPLLGDYFVLYPETGKGINTHNMIIDTFMCLGMIGGIMLIILIVRGIFISYKLMQKRSHINWIGSLFIFSIVSAMVGTTFYMDPFFSVMMLLCFVADKLKLK